MKVIEMVMESVELAFKMFKSIFKPIPYIVTEDYGGYWLNSEF